MTGNQNKKHDPFQVVSNVFDELENSLNPMKKALLGNPAQRTVCRLMNELDHLKILLHKDIESNDSTRIERAEMTANNLHNVFAMAINPELSDERKIQEINRFRDETRHSNLSVAQKLLITSIIGLLAVIAPIATVLVLSSYYGLLLASLLPPALGLSAALFTGILQLSKYWAIENNPDHSRGEKITHELKTLVRERGYQTPKTENQRVTNKINVEPFALHASLN